MAKASKIKKGKKLDIPVENPELVELRAYQNCLYFLSTCNIQLGDPARIFQTANAMSEIYSVVVPKIKALAKKHHIKLPGEEKKEKKDEKR